MIYFTIDEIWRSMLIAVFYGIIYAIIRSCFITIYILCFDLIDSIKQIIVYEKPMEKVVFTKNALKKEGRPITIFISVVLYFIGYIIASYIALDGNLRIYVLILSSAAFYLSKTLIIDKFEYYLSKILRFQLSFLTVFIRMIIYPLRRIYQKICSEIVKKEH